MDVLWPGDGGAQFLEGEVRGFSDIQDDFFLCGDASGGGRHLAGHVHRDDNSAVLVGVDQVAVIDDHARDHDLTAIVDAVDVRVARFDRTGQRLKALSPVRNIADATVGDDTEAAERLMHVRLNLTPKRAMADMRAVQILNHGDLWLIAFVHIAVIRDAEIRRGLATARAGLDAAAGGGAGIADDRRQVRKGAYQRAGGEAAVAELVVDLFQRIANSRCVQGAEGGQFGFGQAVSHRDISSGNYDGGQRPCDLAAVKAVGLCSLAKRRINRVGATNNSLEMEAMIEGLITTLAGRFGISESMARQAISMAMKALSDGGEGDLAGELQQRVPGLSDVAGGGGLMGGLMGAASGLLGGGGGSSPLAGLAGMIGQDKMADVTNVVSGFVGEQTDDDLAGRMQSALTRLSQ